MELDALTVFAVGGVASLLIERFFYYKSRYSKKKNDKNTIPNNPGGYGERIASLETNMKNVKEDIKEIKEELGKK